MPYNKEASTCVFETYYNQWHVDFSVPEIDGITRTWSRNLTAYLISEQFECGGSLHNYGEDGNACCGGGNYISKCGAILLRITLLITLLFLEKMADQDIFCYDINPCGYKYKFNIIGFIHQIN